MPHKCSSGVRKRSISAPTATPVRMATQQQKERAKPVRAAMHHIVHENGYREMDAAELESMLTKNVAPGNTYAFLSTRSIIAQPSPSLRYTQNKDCDQVLLN